MREAEDKDHADMEVERQKLMKKCAVIIQAYWRGFQLRKELKGGKKGGKGAKGGKKKK